MGAELCLWLGDGCESGAASPCVNPRCSDTCGLASGGGGSCPQGGEGSVSSNRSWPGTGGGGSGGQGVGGQRGVHCGSAGRWGGVGMSLDGEAQSDGPGLLASARGTERRRSEAPVRLSRCSRPASVPASGSTRTVTLPRSWLCPLKQDPWQLPGAPPQGVLGTGQSWTAHQGARLALPAAPGQSTVWPSPPLYSAPQDQLPGPSPWHRPLPGPPSSPLGQAQLSWVLRPLSCEQPSVSLGVHRQAPMSSSARPPSSQAVQSSCAHCGQRCLLPSGQPGGAASMRGAGGLQ